MGPNKVVKEDRMVQIYPNWSNMVQNQTKKCPKGSGITRSPGLVFKDVLSDKISYCNVDYLKHSCVLLIECHKISLSLATYFFN